MEIDGGGYPFIEEQVHFPEVPEIRLVGPLRIGTFGATKITRQSVTHETYIISIHTQYYQLFYKMNF